MPSCFGRPRFGLTWPPVQESFNRTQRRQDGQPLSHLVRAVLQFWQLKGNFLGALDTFDFFLFPRGSLLPLLCLLIARSELVLFLWVVKVAIGVGSVVTHVLKI